MYYNIIVDIILLLIFDQKICIGSKLDADYNDEPQLKQLKLEESEVEQEINEQGVESKNSEIQLVLSNAIINIIVMYPFLGPS